MDEATGVVEPPAADPGQDAKAPATSVTSTSERRAGRRGLLTSRKRLALTIDAELTSETGQQKESEMRDGESSTPGSASNSDATNSGSAGDAASDDAVPWWILEYRCPPPGHLGAHDVPVAMKESEQLDAELNALLETEEKQGDKAEPKQQQTVFGRRLAAKPAAESNAEQQQQTEGARDLRQRRQHSIESIGTRLLGLMVWTLGIMWLILVLYVRL